MKDTVKNVKNYYELDHCSQFIKNGAKYELIACAKNFIGKDITKSALIIGPGRGEELHSFKQLRKLVGMEPSKKMHSLWTEDIKEYFLCEDITSCQDFVQANENSFDIVLSNYVLLHFNAAELESAFSNVSRLLKEGGMLAFTITDPRSRTQRHNKYPGYEIEFKKDFVYTKKDQYFDVRLESLDGTYRDIGILDCHQPKEVYDELMRMHFNDVKVEEISWCGNAYALLYSGILK